MSKKELEQLTFEQKIDLIRSGNLWCWKTFWIGIVARLQKIIFSREMIVFIIFAIPFLICVLVLKTDEMWHWIIFGIVSVIFILAEALRILVGQKTTLNINADAKVGATVGANLTGDLVNMARTAIEEVKK